MAGGVAVKILGAELGGEESDLGAGFSTKTLCEILKVKKRFLLSVL